MLQYTADQTDASYLIPARLGIGVVTVGIEDTGGLATYSIYTLPGWIKVGDGGELVETSGLNRSSEVPELMRLDARHNPLLAELWRDDVNDLIADNP